MIYYKQEKGNTCGVACVRMALSHFDDPVPEEQEVAAELNTDWNIGTHPNAVLEYFHTRGYEAFIQKDATMDMVRRLHQFNHVVMLMVSVDVPHFVVYAGDDNNQVFFNDPHFGERSAHRIAKFISPRRNYPDMRWHIRQAEFEKYINEKHLYKDDWYEGEKLPEKVDFTAVEGERQIIAVRKCIPCSLNVRLCARVFYKGEVYNHLPIMCNKDPEEYTFIMRKGEKSGYHEKWSALTSAKPMIL